MEGFRVKLPLVGSHLVHRLAIIEPSQVTRNSFWLSRTLSAYQSLLKGLLDRLSFQIDLTGKESVRT